MPRFKRNQTLQKSSQERYRRRGTARWFLVPQVGNLQASGALALDDDIAVLRAQLDLPNVATGDVNFLGDQGRALQAPASLAFRDVVAPMDTNGRRCGVEVRLKHGLCW